MTGFLMLAAIEFRGEAFELESTGTLAGLTQIKSGNNYYQAEVFAHWNLPWRWGTDVGFHCQPRIGISTGWLHGWNKDAVIGSAGPRVAIGWRRLPMFVEGGFAPTLMSRDKFGPADFGSHLQFTTYGGVTWECGSHVSLG